MAVTASASEVSVHSHFLCGGNSCTAPTVHQGDVQTEFTQKLTSDNGILKIEGTAAGGNSATATGAGVSVWDNCTFNMYGGSITGNNSQYNFGGHGGGGVYVDSSATITLSGNVQIKDNYKGSNSNKKPSNIYLARNKTITADGSLTGSSIGVTTAAEPGTGSNVTFANGSTNTIATGIFTPIQPVSSAAWLPMAQVPTSTNAATYMMSGRTMRNTIGKSVPTLDVIA